MVGYGITCISSRKHFGFGQVLKENEIEIKKEVRKACFLTAV